MRLERLLSIVFILLNREKVQATELAEKFKVSIRTIYRDIKVINQAGIPIYSANGIDGGFSIMEEYRIDKQVLSIKEMKAIVNALKGVNDSLKNHDLDNIIAKICDLLPKSNPTSPDTNNTNLAIDLVPWGMSEKYQADIQNINKAIEKNMVLRFLYSKVDAVSEERVIEPMTIMFKGYTWYLFGFCRLRRDYRIFRISRIKNLQITNQYFVRKNKSYKDYIRWNENTKTLNLKLKFSQAIQTAVEDYFPEKDITYLESGHLMVSTTMPESNWLYGFILGYGSFVEVIEPLDFRDVIAQEAIKISQLYTKKTPK